MLFRTLIHEHYVMGKNFQENCASVNIAVERSKYIFNCEAESRFERCDTCSVRSPVIIMKELIVFSITASRLLYS